MRMIVPLFAAALLLAAPALAQTEAETNEAIDMTMGDYEPFQAAFHAIQDAVVAGDGTAVAPYIPYGKAITINRKPVTFESENDFYAAYDSIFTKDVVDAVAEQAYETLFVSSEGVMFGSGQLWLSGVCVDDACSDFEVKIITIQSFSH